jgi:hypothetical protein
MVATLLNGVAGYRCPGGRPSPISSSSHKPPVTSAKDPYGRIATILLEGFQKLTEDKWVRWRECGPNPVQGLQRKQRDGLVEMRLQQRLCDDVDSLKFRFVDSTKEKEWLMPLTERLSQFAAFVGFDGEQYKMLAETALSLHSATQPVLGLVFVSSAANADASRQRTPLRRQRQLPEIHFVTTEKEKADAERGMHERGMHIAATFACYQCDPGLDESACTRVSMRESLGGLMSPFRTAASAAGRPAQTLASVPSPRAGGHSIGTRRKTAGPRLRWHSMASYPASLMAA